MTPLPTPPERNDSGPFRDWLQEVANILPALSSRVFALRIFEDGEWFTDWALETRLGEVIHLVCDIDRYADGPGQHRELNRRANQDSLRKVWNVFVKALEHAEHVRAEASRKEGDS